MEPVLTHPGLAAQAPAAAPPSPAQPTASPSGMPSALDMLAADVQRELEQETVTIPVPARPGWTIVCSIAIPYEMQAAWLTAAADRSMPGGLNTVSYSATILASQCRAIVAPDGPAGNGAALTFASADLQRVLGAVDACDAARRFFRRDGHLAAAADTVMREAGWGAVITPLTP